VEEDEGVRNLVNRNYKGLATLKKDILYDFFKTAFDGSGGWGGREGEREETREEGCFASCLRRIGTAKNRLDGPLLSVRLPGGLLSSLTPSLPHSLPPFHSCPTGGDNFYDAGSCIDGRLTSAWNWCSQLSSKPFYPIFKLTGFASFDSGVGPGG